MYRGIAQMAERRTHNPTVAGSSPAPATLNRNDTACAIEVCYAISVAADVAFNSSLGRP